MTSPVPLNALFAADLAANDGFVIGELHGTQEAPRAVLDMITVLPGRTLVAVEQSDEIEALDCNGADVPESWTQATQDGRSSVAIRDMICSLRILDAEGRIGLIYIDDRSATKSQYYDTATDRIFAAMQGGDFQQFVAFTGNFHSSNRDGFLPDLLRNRGLDTLSITMAAPAGTAWNCMQGESGLACRARETSFEACVSSGDATPPTPWGWQRFEREPPQWDRCLMLPTMTASPPAHAR